MSIKEGLIVQKNVIYALIQREAITRYSGSSLGYLWATAEPIFHISAYIFFFQITGMKSPVANIPIITFIVSALLPFLMFRKATLSMMSGIESNLALLSYPHVKPIDIFLSRLILEGSVMFTMMVLTFGLFMMLDWFSGATSYLSVLFTYALLLIFALGVGLTNSVIKLYFPSYQEIYSNLMRVVYWTSGIFYAASNLPKQAQDILQYQPLIHFSESFRVGLFDNYQSDFQDTSFIIKISLISLLTGLVLILLVENKIREMHD